TVELSVMTSIADTYFSVLELRDRLRIAQANLASAEQILQGFETDETVGTSTALDVAQQATAVAILLGTTPQSFRVTANSLAGISAPPVVAGVPSQLLARRPDVASAEAQL